VSQKDPHKGSFLLLTEYYLKFFVEKTMEEKIKHLAQAMLAEKKIMLSVLGLLVVLGGGAAAFMLPGNDWKDSLAAVAASELRIENLDVEIAVAGSTSTDELLLGNSWPAELVSLGSVPVQPSREGTIVSWNVYIGQKVYAGQVLGTLSRPPEMPDSVAMLADEEKMLAMARVNLDAKRAYTEERILQLEALRGNTERSLLASQRLLGTNSTDGASGNFSMIEAKKATLRAMLRGTLAKNYEMFSGQGTLPRRWSDVILKDAIGIQNSGLRDKYQTVLFAALDDLNVQDKLPVESGLAYFDLVIQLIDASIPDNSMLMASDIAKLKTMLHMEQEEFIMAVDELRKAELMASETEKMSFEDLRMVDNDIAMLKQDLRMAEGDVASKEVSYRKVEAGTNGGTVIVAERSGTISSILKKPGEFVMPGMPVAVITGTKSGELIVRMRLPSNIKMPDVGEIFSVVRTGFPENVLKAKLVGIGNAIDAEGGVSADAILLEPTDWPVGASLRILSPESTESMLIALSSVWFDAGGAPKVWAVSEAGRVYGKEVIIGRTIGADIEVHDGLMRGDRYIVKPTPGITENMLLENISGESKENRESKPSANPHAGHAGMEM
jgi:multidrug efflux pump subunit AcrA (membrane-fusion protein)